MATTQNTAVTSVANVSLVVPANRNFANIQVGTAGDIYVTNDGSTPSSSNGQLIKAGSRIEYSDDLNHFRARAVSTTTSIAVLFSNAPIFSGNAS